MHINYTLHAGLGAADRRWGEAEECGRRDVALVVIINLTKNACEGTCQFVVVLGILEYFEELFCVTSSAKRRVWFARRAADPKAQGLQS